jgi:hypothetical protein
MVSIESLIQKQKTEEEKQLKKFQRMYNQNANSQKTTKRRWV